MLKPLPKGILQATLDTRSKLYYGISSHDLHALNLREGESVQIPARLEKQPNWLRALTYDAKRSRLVITGRNALYEYSTKDDKWAVLVDSNNGSYSALAWQARTDVLFAIGNNERTRDRAENREAPVLYELAATGGVLRKTLLELPMFIGVMQGGADDRAELIDLGGDLAALIYRENRDSGSGRRGKPEAFLYVIDPKTGKTKLAWKE
jgi:hypothetical protein